MALSGTLVAFAGGGDSIASAPDLPLLQEEFNGKDGLDYWRVPLGVGDRLILDYGSTDGDTVQVCLVRPNVTDYTLAEAECRANSKTANRGQLRFVANPAGRWTLLVGDWACFGYGDPRVRRLPCDEAVAYELTAHVQRYTRLTLSGPGTVRAGQRAILRGRLSGASSGRVEMQYRTRGRWRGFARVPVKAGSFAYRARFPTRGVYQNRAVYSGDDSHRRSVSKVVVTRAV